MSRRFPLVTRHYNPLGITMGMEARHGLAGQRWRDRQDVAFQKVARIKVQDLQSLPPGQFYFLFDSRLELARTFYIGENFADEIPINRFLKVRGPMDRVPGLDQSVEERFSRHLEAAIAGLAGDRPPPVIDRDDEAVRAVRAMLAASRPMAMLEALANCGGAEIRRDDPAAAEVDDARLEDAEGDDAGPDAVAPAPELSPAKTGQPPGPKAAGTAARAALTAPTVRGRAHGVWGVLAADADAAREAGDAPAAGRAHGFHLLEHGAGGPGVY